MKIDTPAERQRALDEIERCIGDWNYDSHIANCVRGTLLAVGMWVASGDGMTGNEAATTWYEHITEKHPEPEHVKPSPAALSDERRAELLDELNTFGPIDGCVVMLVNTTSGRRQEIDIEASEMRALLAGDGDAP